MGSTISVKSIQFSVVSKFAAWILLALVCVFVYWPGLSGPFLFDDFGSLASLGDLGGVKDWVSFKAYVFGGFSGPTGRPLSLLSFLIDANNWPTDPWPFKRTNLFIHLLNGVLLGVITAKILRLVGIDKQRAQWLALVCVAFWLLHPFLVSTTLYAVQRMAQLATLFIFLGILFYLYGRSFIETRPAKAYVTMSLAIALGTSLATISKENGILLPLLVLILEATIFASQAQRITALNRNWCLLFLVAPSVIVTSYLVVHTLSFNFFEPNPPRDFSIYERLLTESRILVDYLKHWFVPELYTAGLFQDHFIKSTGFLAPISTLITAVFHLLLISLCVLKRREWPLLAFGVLFYYGSHLLESTASNLELYFEHRAYLAAAFLIPPLVVSLHDKVRLPIFMVIVCAVMLVLGGFTRYTATIWQSYPAMVEASAKKAPTSARAQQQYALSLYNAQKYDEALQVINAAIERMPEDEQLHMLRSSFHCYLGILSVEEFARMKSEVSTRPFDNRAMGLYDVFFNSIMSQSCPAVSLNDLRGLFADMLNVPLNADEHSLRYAYIKYYLGRIDVQLGEPARAMQSFAESLQARSGASRAMHMASIMASGDFFDEALLLSDTALASVRSRRADLLASDHVTEADILDFQHNIRLEMTESQDP